MIYTSKSLGDTEKLAESFVNHLSVYDGGANIFGFSGDLGSGKTTFTKSVAKLLGIQEHVTSPTFFIQKIYPIDPQVVPAEFPFKKLIHIDAYRLENAHELEVLDFKKDAEDKNNLILIEWPERIIEALPVSTPIIRFLFVSEHVRTIEFPDMMAV